MTATDTFQRDRVQGPKETALARYGTWLTWLTVGFGVVALLVWLYIGTTDPRLRDYELVAPLAGAGSLTVVASALLAARLVVGALRSASAAARQ